MNNPFSIQVDHITFCLCPCKSDRERGHRDQSATSVAAYPPTHTDVLENIYRNHLRHCLQTISTLITSFSNFISYREGKSPKNINIFFQIKSRRASHHHNLLNFRDSPIQTEHSRMPMELFSKIDCQKGWKTVHLLSKFY